MTAGLSQRIYLATEGCVPLRRSSHGQGMVVLFRVKTGERKNSQRTTLCGRWCLSLADSERTDTAPPRALTAIGHARVSLVHWRIALSILI